MTQQAKDNLQTTFIVVTLIVSLYSLVRMIREDHKLYLVEKEKL